MYSVGKNKPWFNIFDGFPHTCFSPIKKGNLYKNSHLHLSQIWITWDGVGFQIEETANQDRNWTSMNATSCGEMLKVCMKIVLNSYDSQEYVVHTLYVQYN